MEKNFDELYERMRGALCMIDYARFKNDEVKLAKWESDYKSARDELESLGFNISTYRKYHALANKGKLDRKTLNMSIGRLRSKYKSIEDNFKMNCEYSSTKCKDRETLGLNMERCNLEKCGSCLVYLTEKINEEGKRNFPDTWREF